MANPFCTFSDDELRDELRRRADVREARDERSALRLCDECVHFAPQGADHPSVNVTRGTGLCAKDHRLRWRDPAEIGQLQYGFYRRNCADRTSKPELTQEQHAVAPSTDDQPDEDS